MYALGDRFVKANVFVLKSLICISTGLVRYVMIRLNTYMFSDIRFHCNSIENMHINERYSNCEFVNASSRQKN